MKKCLKFRQSKGKNSVPLYLEEKVLLEEAKKYEDQETKQPNEGE